MVAAVSNELQPPVRLWDKRLVATAGLAMILLAVDVWALFANVSVVIFALGAVSTLALLLLPAVTAYRTVRLTLQATQSAPVQAYARAALRRSTFWMIAEAVLAIPLFVIVILYADLRLNAIFAHIVVCSQLCPPGPDSIAETEAVMALITGIALWGLNPLVCALGASFAIQSRDTVRAMLAALVIPLILATIAVYALLSSQAVLSLIAAFLPYGLAALAKSLWKSEKKPLQ